MKKIKFWTSEMSMIEKSINQDEQFFMDIPYDL
jgi:hypothetical protein